MTTYQNQVGSLLVNSTGRVENTSALSPGKVSTLCGGFRFRLVSQGTNATFLIRTTSNANPEFGFIQKNAGGMAIRTRHDNGAGGFTNVTTDLPAITNGTDYALFWAFNGSGLSSVDHPDVSGTQYLIFYLYDLSTRTPTATVVTNNAAAAADDIAAQTLIRLEATTSDISWYAQDMFFAQGAGTRTIANHFGQRTRDVRNLGLTLYHHWRLSDWATDVVTNGDPGLADVAGGTERTLTYPSGGSFPAWSQTPLVQPFTSAEDPAVDATFDSVRANNLGLVKRELANTNGCEIEFDSDSFGRIDLAAREPLKWINDLHEEGYTIAGWSCYLRLTNTPVSVTVPSFTGVTPRWVANAGLASSFNNDPAGADDRYGVTMGGILELVSGSNTPTLGTNNEILEFTLNASADGLDSAWFADGDRLMARVLFYIPEAGHFDGTVRIVSEAANHADATDDVYDFSTTGTTVWRQSVYDSATTPGGQDAVSAGTGDGGSRVPGHLNAYYRDIDLGTEGTTRKLSIRIPTSTELDSGTSVFPAAITVYKVTAGGAVVKGLHVINDSDNSAAFDDHFTDAVATTSGSKNRSREQEGRCREMQRFLPANAAKIRVMNIANQQSSEATHLSNLGDYLEACDAIDSSIGRTGNSTIFLWGRFPHQILSDRLHSDRNRCYGWDQASEDFAVANPTRVAFYSMYDWCKGFFGATIAQVYGSSGDFDELGFGEAPQAAVDATVASRFTNAATGWLDSGILHLNTETDAAEMVAGVTPAVLAAEVPAGSVSPSNRIRNRARGRLQLGV